MKIRIILVLVFTALTLSLFSQERLKVAVFDPTASGTGLDEGTGLAVRELISSTLVNTGKYTIIERAMIQQIIKEQKFSNSDLVDESQAAEIGKLAGADKIVLSAVSLVGGRNMLSVKMTDVKTAAIDAQKTKICQSNDLLDVVEPLTKEMLGEKAVYTNKTQNVSQEQSNNKVDKVTESSDNQSGESWELGGVKVSFSNGTLKISGKGTIPANNVPWEKRRRNTSFSFGSISINTGGNSENTGTNIRDKIVEIIIEEGIVAIPDECFQDMNITSVQLPNSLKSIGKNAFESCKNLLEIAIPSKVSVLQENAFANCESLTKVVFEGNNLSSIEKSAFESCKNLFEITIPSKVSILQEKTFYDCESLTRIVFEGRLSSIGESCFENDKKLEVFSLKNCPTPPKLENDAFNDANKKMKVEVSNPSEYQSNKQWKKFF